MARKYKYISGDERKNLINLGWGESDLWHLNINRMICTPKRTQKIKKLDEILNKNISAINHLLNQAEEDGKM